MSRVRLQSLVLILLIVALSLNTACLQESEQQGPSIPQQNTLTLFDAGPTTLDPAISQEAGSHAYVVHIFGGLVTLNQDMEVVGDIAEGWDMSDDGTVYTFHLLRNASFHDGRAIVAADFKYSWERACRPETQSPTAPTYLNDIVGVTEMLAGETGGIEGVRVIDEYTLEVTIDAPKAYFLSKLTYPVAFVVDKADVESGEEWWHEPNGSGPFKLKYWKPDELVLLERNALYHRDKAKLDHVAFLLWGGVPMQMYEKGEIDVTYVSVFNLERVLDATNPLHQELNVFQELSLTYIGLNASKPPFNDPRVRQAFSQAVNKERLVSQLFNHSVIATDTILPLGLSGYTQGIQGLDYNLEQARALLIEAGFGDGADLPPVAITVPGEGGQLASWLTSILWQWNQDLEAQIEVRQLESEAYISRLGEERDEMFLFGWVADYPDPQNFLEVLFRSDTVNNYGEYSNPEVDLLLQQAAIEQDSDIRFELYQQAEQLIVSDAACIPLWFGMNYVLVKPYVKGYVLSPLGIPLLANVSIED